MSKYFAFLLFILQLTLAFGPLPLLRYKKIKFWSNEVYPDHLVRSEKKFSHHAASVSYSFEPKIHVARFNPTVQELYEIFGNVWPLQITLLLSQIRFKITEEYSREAITPPTMRSSKDSWFLYITGNSDRVKCVLRAFMVISSPVVSLVSTTLLLFGKAASNPYYFIPWLFVTLKGLLLVQTDNLISIFKDMMTNSNHRFGSQTEDLKWILFYFTFFLIDLIEVFSFCEIFDFFLILWNRDPGYNEESANLEAVKKEIANIVDNLSKCSSVKSSKMSSENSTEDDEGKENSTKGKSVKIFLKSEAKAFDEHLSKLWWNIEMKNESGENLQKQLDLTIKMNAHSESDGYVCETQDKGELRNFSPTNVSVVTNPIIGNKPKDVD